MPISNILWLISILIGGFIVEFHSIDSKYLKILRILYTILCIGIAIRFLWLIYALYIMETFDIIKGVPSTDLQRNISPYACWVSLALIAPILIHFMLYIRRKSITLSLRIVLSFFLFLFFAPIAFMYLGALPWILADLSGDMKPPPIYTVYVYSSPDNNTLARYIIRFNQWGGPLVTTYGYLIEIESANFLLKRTMLYDWSDLSPQYWDPHISWKDNRHLVLYDEEFYVPWYLR